MTQETQLEKPPTDTISCVSFSRHDSSSLLVSSWDSVKEPFAFFLLSFSNPPEHLSISFASQHVRLYDAVENTLTHSYSHESAVLSVAFASKSVAVSGGFSLFFLSLLFNGSQSICKGLDKAVTTVDLETTHKQQIDSHEDAVSCIFHNQIYTGRQYLTHTLETGLVISGSWDKSVKLFDLRKPKPLVATHKHPHKVHSMDTAKGRLVVATADRRYYMYDLRNFEAPLLEERTGSLKFMTRCVGCMPNGEGYATSSIEGRVSVEFFDNSPESQARKYAFKCHREKQPDGIEKVFPVNALAFHPIQGTFVSGGSDGIVNLWDGFNKKRLRQYPRYPAGISALSFNREGNLLAIGCSYTYEEGEKEGRLLVRRDKPADCVLIRHMSDAETRPKTAAAAS
ncbi:WD40-repeat-containing domain protein [Chytriomyces cf. hyalinus JEL632]|nr:WD40-repeat-containing domain protein [Chytriomyces cf. hyalinus JEL632]